MYPVVVGATTSDHLYIDPLRKWSTTHNRPYALRGRDKIPPTSAPYWKRSLSEEDRVLVSRGTPRRPGKRLQSCNTEFREYRRQVDEAHRPHRISSNFPDIYDRSPDLIRREVCRESTV